MCNLLTMFWPLKLALPAASPGVDFPVKLRGFPNHLRPRHIATGAAHTMLVGDSHLKAEVWVRPSPRPPRRLPRKPAVDDPVSHLTFVAQYSVHQLLSDQNQEEPRVTCMPPLSDSLQSVHRVTVLGTLKSCSKFTVAIAGWIRCGL